MKYLSQGDRNKYPPNGHFFDCATQNLYSKWSMKHLNLILIKMSPYWKQK